MQAVLPHNSRERIVRTIKRRIVTIALLLAAVTGTSAGRLAADQSKSRPLAGVVLDTAGKPVAEAEVWLLISGFDGQPSTLSGTKTDKQGRFRVDVPNWWFQIPRSLRQELGLAAYRSGYRVGGLVFSRSSIPPEEGVRLQLGAAVASTITVLAPDGKPLSKGLVSVESLMVDQVESGVSEDYARRLAEANNMEVKATPNGYLWGRARLPLPQELSMRLAITTDDQGVAKSDVFAFAEVAGLKIGTANYGTQTILLLEHLARQAGAKMEMPKTITLRPVGRLSGRVTAKNLAEVRGLVLALVTRAGTDSAKDSVMVAGSAEVTIDAEGKFDVPAVAEGAPQISLPVRTSPYRIDSSLKPLPKIKAGEGASIEVPLRIGVEVSGIVRERGTNKPIAHLPVLFFYGDNIGEQVLTDAAGRYTCRVAPGKGYRLSGIPKEYVPPDRQRSAVPLVFPENVAQHELPPLELEPAPTLRGKVVDENGNPVPGATVQATWLGYSHRRGHAEIHEVTRVCDQSGAFAIQTVILKTDTFRGPAKDTEARLRARSGDAVTDKPLVVDGDLSKPVTLRISKSYALALAGRVTDTSGKPIAEAKVTIWHRPWMPPPNYGTPRPIRFDGAADIRTDAAGKFQTPRQLERDGEYRAEVEAPGIRTSKTDWLKVSEIKSDRFADLVVNRVGLLAGKVLDRQGRPVASATITRTDDGPQRLRTMSDEHGQFRLTNVPDGRGFLFVEAAGFRFHGQILPAGSKHVEAIVTRTNEPVLKALKTLPDVLSQEKRLALIKRVFEPVLKQTIQKGEDHDKYRVLNLLAGLEPARVLEIIDQKPFKDASYGAYPRSAAARTLAKTSLHEAIAILEAMPDSYTRAYNYLEFAELVPLDKKAKKIELLGQALVQARNIQDASQRAVMLALIADRLWSLGEKDRAQQLIAEGHKLGKNLPTQAWAGYARSVVAQSVALTDLPAALELIKDLRTEGEYDRQHGKMAIRIADKNPAEAERIVALLKEPSRLYRYTVRPIICYRMAPVDLERARRIADNSGDPYYRAYGYAKIAQALAKSKPVEAGNLLHEAFAQLKALVESGKDGGNGMYDAAALAAALLFVAEQIDPQLVPEFLWRALALRQPPTDKEKERGRSYLEARSASHDASLAMALARYDRGLARAVLEPWSKRVAALLDKGTYPHRVYDAAVLIDPHWAIDLAQQLPDSPLKTEIARSQVKLLSLQGHELWRYALVTGPGIQEDDKDDF